MILFHKTYKLINYMDFILLKRQLNKNTVSENGTTSVNSTAIKKSAYINIG